MLVRRLKAMFAVTCTATMSKVGTKHSKASQLHTKRVENDGAVFPIYIVVMCSLFESIMIDGISKKAALTTIPELSEIVVKLEKFR